jgi:flagellar assembly protein FliH
MSAAPRFLFGEDFRGPSPEETLERDTVERAAQEEAVRQAFQSGVQDGLRQGAAASERRLAEAMERISAEAIRQFSALDAQVEAVETEALAYFDALARRLAGSALAGQPLAAVADAGKEAFRHLRGVPHLVARVGPDLIDETEALLRRMSREQGFEGRIIVIGDEELGPGDVRLEWAEGGIARDRARFERAIERAVAGATGPADAEHGTGS